MEAQLRCHSNHAHRSAEWLAWAGDMTRWEQYETTDQFEAAQREKSQEERANGSR